MGEILPVRKVGQGLEASVPLGGGWALSHPEQSGQWPSLSWTHTWPDFTHCLGSLWWFSGYGIASGKEVIS